MLRFPNKNTQKGNHDDVFLFHFRYLNTGWIAMAFSLHLRDPQRMTFTDIGDPIPHGLFSVVILATLSTCTEYISKYCR